MEVVPGGNSRLDVTWWLVATGILIFLPPPMFMATTYCADSGVIPCPMNELAGVSCSYEKGKQVLQNATRTKSPGPVQDLRVEPVLKKYSDTKCGVYFNISWALPLYGAAYCTGFLLNVTYFYQGEDRAIYRTYNLSVADWNNDEILNTAFRHECIAPFNNVSYRVEVHSLPLSKSQNLVVKRFFGSVTQLEETLCTGGSIDPRSRFNWIPTIWENVLTARDGSVNVEICFFMAPKELGFEGYRLALQNNSDDRSVFKGPNQDENDTIMDNGAKSRRACRTFYGVCTGTYQAKVLPIPSDLCYHGETTQDCRPIIYQPIEVKSNSSACILQTKTSLSQTQEPFMTAHSMHSDAQEDGGNNSKIAVVVCGVLAAAASAAIIIAAAFRCRKRYGKGRDEPDYQVSSEFDPPPEPCLKRQPVLLIYSTDNESHRKVVRSFAAYLNAWCGCDVLYDEWSQVEIAQTSPIEWLSKQMYNVRHVIIVNSLGAHLQHTGWIERRSYHPSTNLLLPDVFVPALRQVQNKMFSKSARFHSFHVCFPHTKPKHVLDLSCGRCYALMDHVEDLFLNVHGLSKFSARGTTSANRINAADYANTKEGRALRMAIEEAIDFERENPDWFRRYFRTEESGPTDAMVDLDRYPPPSNRTNEESDSGRHHQQDESGNGSIGTASDMEYYPPSIDEGCSGCRVDLGGGGGVPASSDDGIGGMMGDQDPAGPGAIDAASLLPLFAHFSPVCPDDLEDDASSIGSRSFIAKVRELNDQYDSGYYPSIQT